MRNSKNRWPDFCGQMCRHQQQWETVTPSRYGSTNKASKCPREKWDEMRRNPRTDGRSFLTATTESCCCCCTWKIFVMENKIYKRPGGNPMNRTTISLLFFSYLLFSFLLCIECTERKRDEADNLYAFPAVCSHFTSAARQAGKRICSSRREERWRL